MRQVKYKTYWAYASGGIEREGTLLDLELDMLYLMDDNGVIPPIHVLNERLQTGGDNGGMSPGTKWRPFKIKETEYQELVQSLLTIEPAIEKAKHPSFTSIKLWLMKIYTIVTIILTGYKK